MKPIKHIQQFIHRYHKVTHSSTPNFIRVKWQCRRPEPILTYATFDFKNDDARRAFGALCHVLYTSSEIWEITTHRRQ